MQHSVLVEGSRCLVCAPLVKDGDKQLGDPLKWDEWNG